MTLASDTVVGHLGAEEQALLVRSLRSVVSRAPLYTPSLHGTTDMLVRITNAGPYGWTSDKHGYRYCKTHPNGSPWPEIPRLWIEIAERFCLRSGQRWDAAHVVWYGPGASLGEHRDQTEHDRSGEIVTISLGDPAVWAVVDDDGVRSRCELYSGDVTRLAGETRSLIHSIPSVDTSTASLFGGSPLTRPGRVAISVRSGAGPHD